MLPFITFAGISLIYALTLATGLTGGDSGELLLIAREGGIAHPPGYPLFSLLFHGTSLALGEPSAWCLHLLNAVIALLALITLWFVLAELDISPPIRAICCAWLAFTDRFWTYATSVEVFSLNHLLLALFLLIAIRCYKKLNPQNSLYLGLIIGLCACHHHLSALLVLPVLFFLIHDKKKQILPFLPMLISGVIVGLLPYLYLPLNATSSAPMVWGETGHIEGFLKHFFRVDYGTFQLGVKNAASSGLFERLLHYITHLGLQLWLGVAVLFYSRRQSFISSKQLWICLGFYLFVFGTLANLDIHHDLLKGVEARFWQQADLIVMLLLAIGLQTILTQFAKWQKQILALSACSVMALTFINWQNVQWNKSPIIEQYAKAILTPLPANSILFATHDVANNATLYEQQFHNFRKDVKIIHYNLFSLPWYQKHLAKRFPKLHFGTVSVPEFIRMNISTQPIFISGGFTSQDMPYLNDFFTLPIGLVNQVLARSQLPSLPMTEILTESQQALALFNIAATQNAPYDSWEKYLGVLATEAQSRVAEFSAKVQHLQRVENK